MKKSNWWIYAIGAVVVLSIFVIGVYVSFFSVKTEPINMGSFIRNSDSLPTIPDLDKATLDKIINGSSFHVAFTVQGDPRAKHKTVTQVINIPESGINQNKAERRNLVNQKRDEYKRLVDWFTEPKLPFENRVYLIVDTTEGVKPESVPLTARALDLFKIQDKIEENQSVSIQILKITGTDAYTARNTDLQLTFSPKNPWDESKLKTLFSKVTNRTEAKSPIASTLGKVIRDLNVEGKPNPTLIIISDGLENSEIVNTYQNAWAFTSDDSEDSKKYTKIPEITKCFLEVAEKPDNLSGLKVYWAFPPAPTNLTTQNEAKTFWRRIFTSQKAQFTLVD